MVHNLCRENQQMSTFPAWRFKSVRCPLKGNMKVDLKRIFFPKAIPPHRNYFYFADSILKRGE